MNQFDSFQQTVPRKILAGVYKVVRIALDGKESRIIRLLIAQAGSDNPGGAVAMKGSRFDDSSRPELFEQGHYAAGEFRTPVNARQVHILYLQTLAGNTDAPSSHIPGAGKQFRNVNVLEKDDATVVLRLIEQY
jgi:hypothetical protein